MLLVIDGVRSRGEWDLINASFASGMRHGCCIAVITVHESVAAYCADTTGDAMYKVKGLQDSAAFGLFEKEGFKVEGNLSVQVWRLLSMCGGLPRFIITLARHLAEQSSIERRDMEIRLLNENFMHQLENNAKLDCLKDTLAWLHYNCDASPQLVKKCIFYLSVFPSGSIFRRKRLVRRLIAEGYSRGTNIKSWIEETEKLVDKLVDLGVIQSRQMVPACSGMRMTGSNQVNSLFLEAIIMRQTEERTFLPLEFSELEGRCSLAGERVGQHLAIRRTWEGDESEFDTMDFYRLRSLTVSGEWRTFFISDKMRVLRVLDLEGTSDVTNADMEQIVKLLHRLKYLSLRKCRQVTCLPDSIGGLVHLQTLDISHTCIVRLPKSIIELQRLQYIRAVPAPPCQSEPDEPPALAKSAVTAPSSTEAEQQPTPKRRNKARTLIPSWCSSGSPPCRNPCFWTGGVEFPLGMENLKALHTLGVVDLSSKGGRALLAELIKKNWKLTQLRKLAVCGLNCGSAPKLLDGMSRIGHLESLSVKAKELQGCFKLPPNLVKLSLNVTGLLTQCSIDALMDHNKLRTLRLRANTVEDEKLQFFPRERTEAHDIDGHFIEVKELEISCTSGLEVIFSQQAMQKLEGLKIHCHSGSAFKISGLKHLTALKQVLLVGSCDITLKESLTEQLAGHIRKPALLMEEQLSSRSCMSAINYHRYRYGDCAHCSTVMVEAY